jgi:hypothetical protein
MDLTDPIALVERLTTAKIRQRLDTLEAQQAALKTLLRAAEARERTEQHSRRSAKGASSAH